MHHACQAGFFNRLIVVPVEKCPREQADFQTGLTYPQLLKRKAALPDERVE